MRTRTVTLNSPVRIKLTGLGGHGRWVGTAADHMQKRKRRGERKRASVAIDEALRLRWFLTLRVGGKGGNASSIVGRNLRRWRRTGIVNQSLAQRDTYFRAVALVMDTRWYVVKCLLTIQRRNFHGVCLCTGLGDLCAWWRITSTWAVQAHHSAKKVKCPLTLTWLI